MAAGIRYSLEMFHVSSLFFFPFSFSPRIANNNNIYITMAISLLLQKVKEDDHDDHHHWRWWDGLLLLPHKSCLWTLYHLYTFSREKIVKCSFFQIIHHSFNSRAEKNKLEMKWNWIFLYNFACIIDTNQTRGCKAVFLCSCSLFLYSSRYSGNKWMKN